MVNVSVCRPLNLFLPLYFPCIFFLLMFRYFLTSYSCFHVVLSLVFDISICYLFYFYLYPIITLLSWSLLLILIVLFFWFCYFSVSEFSVFHIPFLFIFLFLWFSFKCFRVESKLKTSMYTCSKFPRSAMLLHFKKNPEGQISKEIYILFLNLKKDHKM